MPVQVWLGLGVRVRESWSAGFG